MDFKINVNTSSLGNLNSSSNSRIKGRLNVPSSEDSVSFEDAAASDSNLETYNKSAVATPTRKDLGSIENAISKAESAAGEIEALASRRLELANLAEDQPAVSDYARDLQDEADAIESEIERIRSSATYNGTNVLSGATYQYTDTESDTARTVSTAAFSSGVTGVSLDLQSESGVEDAIENSEASLSAIRSIGSSYSGAKSESIQIAVDEAVKTEDTNSESAEDALQKAQDIAASIASQLSSADPSSSQAAELIEAAASGLDPDRVRDLLA